MQSISDPSLKRYTIAGLIFVLITGTTAHFAYEWSGCNRLLGLFFPVSESTWEHMKLVFFPLLLYSLFMTHKLKDSYPCIRCSLMCGIITGTFLIPVIFYTYSGILGRNYMFLDIATFTVSVIAAFAVIYRLTGKCTYNGKCRPLVTVLLTITVAAMFAGFVVFTYVPPQLGIFEKPAETTAGSFKSLF